MIRFALLLAFVAGISVPAQAGPLKRCGYVKGELSKVDWAERQLRSAHRLGSSSPPSCDAVYLGRLLRDRDAEERLLALALDPSARVPGRLYAAAGLRALDSESLSEALLPLVGRSDVVAIQVGCEGAAVKVSKIVDEVRTGRWPLELAGKVPFTFASPAGRP